MSGVEGHGAGAGDTPGRAPNGPDGAPAHQPPPSPVPGYPPAPPPGYPPAGAYGSPMAPPDIVAERQSGDRARLALWVGLVGFVVQAACSVGLIIVSRDWYVDLFEAISEGRRLTNAQMTPPSGSTAISTASQLASFVVLGAGIVFLIWMHRALTNARSLGLRLTHSPGWGVAGFIVPVINLWFPYQAMRDLFPEGHPSRGCVARWFATYLGASILTSVAGIVALVVPAAAIAVVVLVAVMYVVAAVTARELIAASAEAHAELAGAVYAGGGPAAPAPGMPAPGAPAPAPGASSWVAPPPAPPKDPWGRT